MKDRLLAIFNTLKMVETRGESTIILADCMREFARIIQEIEKQEATQVEENKDE